MPRPFVMVSPSKPPPLTPRVVCSIPSFPPWLHPPQLKSQVLPHAFRKSLENLPGVTFPNNGRVFRPFGLVAHERDYSSKDKAKYTFKCISQSRTKSRYLLRSRRHAVAEEFDGLLQ